MSDQNQICVIIGASHGGVNAAFALRKEGWEGSIILFDSDPEFPYHRPPLSKAFLTSDNDIESYQLKSAQAYEKADITLKLGERIAAIDPKKQTVQTEAGFVQAYHKLILATGARPFIPPIPGLASAVNAFPLRTAQDVMNIRTAVDVPAGKKVVVIGGGYIGLEIAASLKNLGAEVTVLEREARLLARVTSPEISGFFKELHQQNGVEICLNQDVISIETVDGQNTIHCADGTQFAVDVIIIGVGIRLNTQLAEAAGLNIDNGIRVDETTRTSDVNIYAIGDVTNHYNSHYQRFIRLESVQNAVDQSKIAAAAICGKEVKYDTIPWFWSDQFDVKLQTVGLFTGYDNVVVREEPDEGSNKLSAWYFKGNELLAVDALNNAKAYVLGTKFIKDRAAVNKSVLSDNAIPLNFHCLTG